MVKAEDAGLVTADPQIFVKNSLAIVTPPENPAGISSYEDLANDGLKLVICAEQVPCGSATQTLAEQTGLTLSPVSEENAVTDVLAKVTSGEADAGVVYITDATGAGDAVHTITIPDDVNVINSYPVAPLAATTHPVEAQQFADYLITGAGADVLAAAGFVQP